MKVFIFLIFTEKNQPIYIDKTTGYTIFNSLDLPYCKEMLDACEQIIKSKDTQSLLLDKKKNASKSKPWRIDLLEEKDLINNPEILKFAVSNTLVNTVSNYLGTVPRMVDIRLWWSEANNKTEGSQMYHFDQNF